MIRIILLGLAIVSAAPAMSADFPRLAFEADVRRVEFPSPTGVKGVGMLLDLPGPGKKPAVVYLHGSNGPGDSPVNGWAIYLRQQGYIGLVVDQYGPRGITEVYTGHALVKTGDQVRDTVAAKDFLVQQANVDSSRIFMLGTSAGGITALAIAGRKAQASGSFRAMVAIYPDCYPYRTLPFYLPTFIGIGELDDWTRADKCEELMAKLPAESASVKLVIYEGAYHGFDDPNQPMIYNKNARNGNIVSGYGATIAGNPGQARKAQEDVLNFLKSFN